MGKTSKYTGTQKKAQKAEAKYVKKAAEVGVKDLEKKQPYVERARKRTEKTAFGKNRIPESLTDIMRNHERAGKGAEKIFAPIKEQAISDYQRFTQPSLALQHGPASSALKQAKSQASIDLQRGLSSDFARIQNDLANNLTNQSYGNKLSNLNAQMQSNAQLMGQAPGPVISGLSSQSPYRDSKGDTSGMGGTIIGGLLSAGGQFAGSTAGSAAIASLFGSSREIKENIREYDKGLDVVRDLEVKQYDYKMSVPGNQKDRVGLIAEDVPEEIQGMIGDVKAIDVYGLVALLVNAVKQLDEKVKVLEAR
jgi:hypothetical protein